MKRWAKEALFVLVALALVRAWQTRDLAAGELPELRARTLAGEPVVLGGKTERPTLVHVWATWCGVCRAEEQNVRELAQGARVITIASQSGAPDDVRRYMRERGLDFPVINDASGALAAKLGVHAFPTSFFVDSDGHITSREVGYTTTLGLRARLWYAGL